MAIPAQPLPTIGSPNSSEDPKIRSALSELQTILTGAADTTNLAATVLAQLGLTTGRGFFSQAVAGTRANAAYGALTNGPDIISGITLPTNGHFIIGYEALWNQSAGTDAAAAIFLGGNQIKIGASTGVPIVQECSQTGTTNNGWLHTTLSGLVTQAQTGAASTGGITTGMILGHVGTGGGGGLANVAAGAGVTVAYANTGTYDVEIKFKAATGTVTVSSRRLLVLTFGF